jgi:hypothetical protein
VLERLESYACYEIGRKTIPATGSIRLFGRDAYLGTMAGREVTFFESLEGLEAQFNLTVNARYSRITAPSSRW